jgi:hypothetical protein
MKKRKETEVELKRLSAATQKASDEASVNLGRSNERILNAREWEEDIAVYGSLASM